MGLFNNSKTTSNTSNTTTNTADSWNKTTTRTDIVADSGNTNFSLTVPANDASGGGLSKYLPWVAVACLGLALVLVLMGDRKPWEQE